MNKQTMKCIDLVIDELVDDPNIRARGRAPLEADLKGLMDSINTVGLLRPITVVRRTGTWAVVDGWRRVTALTRLGHKIVHAVESSAVDDTEALAIHITLNLDTDSEKRLNPIEEALGFKRLLASGLDATAVSRMVGYSGQHIRNTLKLLDTPKAIQVMVSSQQLTKQAAIAVSYFTGKVRDRVVRDIRPGFTEREVRQLGQRAAVELDLVDSAMRRGNGLVRPGRVIAPQSRTNQISYTEELLSMYCDCMNDNAHSSVPLLRAKLATAFFMVGWLSVDSEDSEEFERELAARVEVTA